MKSSVKRNLGREYYKDGATPQNLEGYVSKSMLFDFFRSPYKWLHSKKRESTPAMDFGRLVHAIALTPEDLGEFVKSPFDNFRTKEAQNWKAEAVESGMTIVSDEDFDKAHAISSSFWEGQSEDGETEVAVYSQIGDTKLKGMIDFVPAGSNALVDLKTTASIDGLDGIARNIATRGYHWQAALYLDLWNAATGENRNQFLFYFVETSAPHEGAWISIDEDFIQRGRIAYMQALSKWNECIKLKNFPKQIEGIQTISAPKWLV
jgi:hypothetical protein